MNASKLMLAKPCGNNLSNIAGKVKPNHLLSERNVIIITDTKISENIPPVSTNFLLKISSNFHAF
jgi:hypothetical protein